YGKQFRGPHSDLIGAVLLLGVPGAALLLGALAAFGWRCLRAARDGPLDAGLLAALAALAAHASVDDLFGARPAAALAAAMLLGACAGRREATESVRPARAPGIWTPSVAARLAVGVSVVALLLGAELRPYAAFRARSAGDPTLAAALDPASATNLLAAARSGVGSPAERFLHADDGTWRAVRAAPANPHVRAARAELLSRACLGSLPEIGVCESAIASWSGALALRPHDVQSRRARARLQMLLGRPGTAIADFRLAIHDEPSYLGARDDLVRALEETGRPRAAARERSARRQVIEGLEGFRPMSRYERMLLTRDEPPPAARPDDGRGRGTREAADDRRSDVARERLAP
ncbi:MAG: hypothetical protein OEQ13_05425, partial [Acidobacteriota bacterium]|nr:hypothetical protein [Acidobacteriota bacterium]